MEPESKPKHTNTATVSVGRPAIRDTSHPSPSFRRCSHRRTLPRRPPYHSLMACVAQRVHQLDVDAQPRLLTLAQSWFGSEALPHSIRFKTVTPCATVLSIKVSSRRSVGVPQRLMGMHRRSPVSSRRCSSDTKSFTADRPASQKAYTVVPDTGEVISGS